MLELENAYWTGFDLEDLAWQADALRAGGNVVVHRLKTDTGALALMVSGADRAGLFADLAGTLARLGANIVSAQLFTSQSGQIVDIFMLHDVRGQPFATGDAGRLAQLVRAIGDVLGGRTGAVDIKYKAGRREAAFLVQPSVQVHDELSADCTVIDVAGRDRPGLLYEVGAVLAELKLSIRSAHVGSYGERVFDAFYVQTQRGAKLRTKAQKEAVREQLLAVLANEEPGAPETPARKLKQSRAVDSF